MPHPAHALLMARPAGGFSDPSDLPGLSNWYDPSDTSTTWEDSAGTTPATGTDPLGRVDDKSGNGRNATQATAGSRPALTTLNSLGAINHTADRYLDLPMPSSPSNAYLFAVVKAAADPADTDATSGIWTIGVDSGGSASHYPYTDGTVYDGTLSSTRKTVGNLTPSLAATRVLSIRSSSGSWKFDLDGTQVFSTGTNAVELPGTGRWGWSRNGGGGIYYFRGVFGELFIGTATLTDQQRDDAVAYLIDKWT